MFMFIPKHFDPVFLFLFSILHFFSSGKHNVFFNSGLFILWLMFAKLDICVDPFLGVVLQLSELKSGFINAS